MISAILPNRFVAVMSPVVMFICFMEITDIFPKSFSIHKIMSGGKVLEAGSAGNIIFSLCVILFLCSNYSKHILQDSRREDKNEIV